MLGVGQSAIHQRANAVDDEAIASMQLDRATFSAAINGSLEALDRATINGDGATVHRLFASLAIFGVAAIIEP